MYPNDEDLRPVLHFWTYQETRQALPYIRSVLHSVRDRWIDKQAHQCRARRLEERSGKPGRGLLVELAHAIQEADFAHHELDLALGELHAIDVFCIDPVRARPSSRSSTATTRLGSTSTCSPATIFTTGASPAIPSKCAGPSARSSTRSGLAPASDQVGLLVREAGEVI